LIQVAGADARGDGRPRSNLAERAASRLSSGSSAAMVELPDRDQAHGLEGRTSIVLAVNMPPQLRTGAGGSSRFASSSASSMRPRELGPTASKALTTVRSQGPSLPGLESCRVDKDRRNCPCGHASMATRGMLLVAAGRSPAARPCLWALQAFRCDRRSPRATQRIFHPLGAHRDAVADGDGAKRLRQWRPPPRAATTPARIKGVLRPSCRA